jgi:hypothetical protein
MITSRTIPVPCGTGNPGVPRYPVKCLLVTGIGSPGQARESVARITQTLSSIVRFAVFITRCSRSQRWYCPVTTSAQVGVIMPGISAARAWTLRRCSSGAEHVTSISTALTRARFATATQASRVSQAG